MSLTLKVVSPEGTLLDTQADSVQLPALDGSLGIMPGHRDMVLALSAGDLRYRQGADWHTFPIAGGLAQMNANCLIVLADAGNV